MRHNSVSEASVYYGGSMLSVIESEGYLWQHLHY